MAAGVGGVGGWGVEVAGSGSTGGVLVGVSGGTGVLVGKGVGSGTASGVRVGAAVAVGSGLGTGVTIGIGVFVGVGVTVEAPALHPLSSSTVAPANAIKTRSGCLEIVICPSNPCRFDTMRLVPWATVSAKHLRNQTIVPRRRGEGHYTH